MLNRSFIIRKIKLIQEDLSRLEAVSKYTFEQIVSDGYKYFSTERFLERIVTRALDINRHIIGQLGKGSEVVRSNEDTFLVLDELGIYPKKFAKDIAPSAGLRNILVHEYDKIDEKIIYRSIKDALAQYSKYCDYILSITEKN